MRAVVRLCWCENEMDELMHFSDGGWVCMVDVLAKLDMVHCDRQRYPAHAVCDVGADSRGQDRQG